MSDSQIDPDNRDKLLDASRKGDTLGLSVEQLEDFWIEAGERYDAELSEALGGLLDVAEASESGDTYTVGSGQPSAGGRALIDPSEQLDEQAEAEHEAFMRSFCICVPPSGSRTRGRLLRLVLPRTRRRGAGRPRRRLVRRRTRSGPDPPDPSDLAEQRRGAARALARPWPRRVTCQGRRP